MANSLKESLIGAESLDKAREAVFVLIEKKALNVKLYCVKETSPITDYYVNVTGRSQTQVASLADEVVYRLSLLGLEGARVEGKKGNSWILVDYNDVIINVFDGEARDFYNLDRLFPQESQVDISDIVTAVDEKMNINNAEDK